MNPDRYPQQRLIRNRRNIILGLLGLATVGIVARAVYLQLIHDDFLRQQGNARFARDVRIPAHRGMILDRNGEPLAVSSPVGSIWVDPAAVLDHRAQLPRLAAALQLNPRVLTTKLDQWATAGRQFEYLRRQMAPSKAQAITALGIDGVHDQREYRRYYPDAEVSANLIGFTDINDQGQAGLELAFNDILRGRPGLKRVVRDPYGHTVEELRNIRDPQPGQTLVLSIDRRIQYYAYRALKATVLAHHAEGGSVVVLDPNTGEILAIANQPSANPNDRSQRKSALLRDRAVTDVFEPGSTLKPFTVALALEHHIVTPSTPIDARPGYFRIGRNVVHDVHDYGLIDVARVIIKSSNVGISKIALMMPPEWLWQIYKAIGFGSPSGLDFPGEQSGVLENYKRWGDFEYATHAFGYGVSVTTLQLAQAYAVLASGGIRRPLSIVRRSEAPAQGVRVLSAHVVHQILQMLEKVVSSEGTAVRAEVPGYRVAGKTGTVHKVIDGHYAPNDYYAVFVGLAPVSHPELVIAVMVNDPQGRDYYGGEVAAPLFSEVMGSALRLRGVPPDAIGGLVQTASR